LERSQRIADLQELELERDRRLAQQIIKEEIEFESIVSLNCFSVPVGRNQIAFTNGFNSTVEERSIDMFASA